MPDETLRLIFDKFWTRPRSERNSRAREVFEDTKINLRTEHQNAAFEECKLDVVNRCKSQGVTAKSVAIPCSMNVRNVRRSLSKGTGSEKLLIAALRLASELGKPADLPDITQHYWHLLGFPRSIQILMQRKMHMNLERRELLRRSVDRPTLVESALLFQIFESKEQREEWSLLMMRYQNNVDDAIIDPAVKQLHSTLFSQVVDDFQGHVKATEQLRAVDPELGGMAELLRTVARAWNNYQVEFYVAVRVLVEHEFREKWEDGDDGLRQP